MSDIRIIPDEDLDKFYDIFLDAYPGIHSGSADEKKKLKPKFLRRHDDPRISLWGLYRHDELLGGLRLFDYNMNVHGARMLTGGGGCLAVSLMHKRQHVAKELMQFFQEHYRSQGAPLSLLWSFRPDFYRKMGYGLGTRINVYEIKPENFPHSGGMEHVRFLTRDDLPAITDCYNRFVDRHHGMIEETLLARQIGWELTEALRWIGYVEDGCVRGFFAVLFEKAKDDSFIMNNMDVSHVFCDSPDVLSELLTFLHSQFDQIYLVRLRTFDDNFHYLLKDPRNSSRDLFPPVYHPTHQSGTGIMYRVVDTRLFFELLRDHSFGGQTCKLKLTIADSFMPSNSGSVIVHFNQGRPVVASDDAAFEIELSMDIADFSSLVMGAVDLKSMYRYSLARLSDASYLGTLNAMFASDRPICTTSF